MKAEFGHWDAVYQNKDSTEVSWYEPSPATSLAAIRSLNLHPEAAIVDVGGGASLLVDHLVDDGLRNLSVLDLSERALTTAQQRLGDRAEAVQWITSDVLTWTPTQSFDLWHDRAVFHFLTEKSDRIQYAKLASVSITPGGHLLIATFSTHGPSECSGLAVQQYNGPNLAAEFGSDFVVIRAWTEEHFTPWKTPQEFTWLLLQRKNQIPNSGSLE